MLLLTALAGNHKLPILLNGIHDYRRRDVFLVLESWTFPILSFLFYGTVEGLFLAMTHYEECFWVSKV